MFSRACRAGVRRRRITHHVALCCTSVALLLHPKTQNSLTNSPMLHCCTLNHLRWGEKHFRTTLDSGLLTPWKTAGPDSRKDGRRFSLSLGIQLLGFAHRTIHVSRAQFPVNRRPKQAIPANPETFGERMRLARFQEGITRAEMAQNLGVSIYAVEAWEWNKKQPTACMKEQIGQMLDVATT